MRDLGPVDQLLHRHLPKMLGVTNRHVNQKVVGSGDVKEAEHLALADGVLAKGVDRSTRVILQANRDHRLETNAQNPGLDLRMKSPNNTLCDQALDSFKGG